MKVNKVSTTMETLSHIILKMLDEKIDIIMTVTGTSMNPMLRHKRDKVILTACDKFSLRIGDIPLYKRNSGNYVLHRIIKVNENSYDLCGDNQYIIERNVPKENVIAVVNAFERDDKLYRCNDVMYRLYWHFWIFTIPFRGLMQQVRLRLRRLK